MTRDEKLNSLLEDIGKKQAELEKARSDYAFAGINATDDPKPQAEQSACGDSAQNSGCDETCPPCCFRPSDDPEPQDGVDKSACIAATICAHGYLQNPEDEGRVAHVIRQSLESPEPHADDVETIIDFEEVEKALQMAEKVGEETKNPTPWQFNTLMQVRRAKVSLARLSAPIDVQAKADAVESILIRKCSLTGKERKELSRLIVEQFSRKG
jgi:hypothetical protein